MDKRYQVFVSSTFIDLQEERRHVMQALMELDCMPSGMELFPATDDDQWSLIKKVIDDSDYYIVVLAGRYGSLAPSGMSYTEMEYRYALEVGKPIIGFVHSEVENLAVRNSEISDEGREKLKGFRELVQKKHCKFWSSAAELGGLVSRSFVKLMKSNPGVGWVKADLVPSQSAAQEILVLRRRIEELEREITSASTSEPEGAVGLAKGADLYSLSYNFVARDDLWNTVEYEYSSEISWEDLFSAISPVMINEASDSDLKRALNSVAKVLYEESHTSDNDVDLDTVNNFEVWEDDYHTIIIQLRSLGLIAQSIRARRAQDSLITFWTLTPYGDTVMIRSRAIKRD